MKRQHRRALLAGVALLAALPAWAQSGTASWKQMEFLLGAWTGAAQEKDTPQGAGQGAFSFEPELNRKIIVRRNHAGYDSGTQHDDLMVIYLDAPGETPRAIYFDTEGHVIRYNLSFPAANRAVFESDPAISGPRYRLSYKLEGASLNGTFEVAPPGAAFQPYLRWTSKKR